MTQFSGAGATIFGCAGERLGDAERRFFREAAPAGLILFQRNCRDPAQIRALVNDYRDTVGNADAPVLIDQEGGRVARLKPPQWIEHPPAAVFGRLHAKNSKAAARAARLTGRLLAAELLELGITVDCVPVLDVPDPDGHEIIGDRAFGATPAVIVPLARALVDGLEAGGVQPVIKHIPGHGRAGADSHHRLPRVEAPHKALSDVDFAPFKAFRDAPWAMTAHVVYTALDPEAPATLSKAVVAEAIRGEIGFEGVLMTDDLSMKALEGGFRERAERAVAAGCDLILHCNGEMAEMEAVAAGAGRLAGQSLSRVEAAVARRGRPAEFDRQGGLEERDRLLERIAGV